MLFVKFVDGDLASRTHNVHMVGMGEDLWNDRLIVRDHPRKPRAAGKYPRLKHHLADRFRDYREAYTDAKTGFVSTVVEREKA